MHRIHSMWSILAVCSAVIGGGTAEAQTDEEREQARAAYARGQELYQAGSYAEAEAAFNEAYRIIPNPVVLLGVAEARERGGNLPGAVEILERYLTERPDAPDREQIDGRIERMRATPATIVVQSTPAGATVALDGQPTGRTTPAELEVPPGSHVVSVALGEQTRADSVDAVYGGRHELTLDVTPPAPEPVPELGDRDPLPEPEPEPVVEDDGGEGGPGTAVWVSAGIAGAALVSGTVLGFLSLSEQSDFDEMPTESAADRGERLALFADLSFGIAAAAAITGVVLYVTGTGATEEETAVDARGRRAPSVAVAPAVGPNGGGVAARVEF